MTQNEKKIDKKNKKAIRCLVVSDKMNKTRVGTVERSVKHPVYGKYMRKTTRFMFHDEKNESVVGDEVVISECHPLSSKKSFMFIKKVKSSKE